MIKKVIIKRVIQERNKARGLGQTSHSSSKASVQEFEYKDASDTLAFLNVESQVFSSADVKNAWALWKDLDQNQAHELLTRLSKPSPLMKRL
ncbi:hypothetical protein DSO57_1005727 [Entomophthora muscae]|nr:hypothetical protein DSO57_1022311 [Entomophthora muscae]KAJ9070633.1 hypothetical protein DSO57_1005727 [Entomophthora muscae]